MDLALEGVHVLVTGTAVSSLQNPLNAIVYSGASGGIGLETVRLFLGPFPCQRAKRFIHQISIRARGYNNSPLQLRLQISRAVSSK